MKYFFDLAFLFLIGSTLGWCLELLFRRFVSSKRWINPGFLNGPYLPLYGFGVIAMYLICSVPIEQIWAKILLIFVLMTLIEYIAGLIFIKGMKIKLWDYSNRFGNIQGIICPLFSVIWGAIGVFFLFVVYPLLTRALGWMELHSGFLFVLGMFYGVVLVDVIISFHLAVKIKAALKGVREAIRYDDIKAKIKADRKSRKERISFLFAFRSDKPVTEYIKDMLLGKLKKVPVTELPEGDTAAAEQTADSVVSSTSGAATEVIDDKIDTEPTAKNESGAEPDDRE